MKYSLQSQILSRAIIFLLFLGATASLNAQSAIGLSFPDKKVKAGETVCLPITVFNFQSMLSMQYSVSFDPTKLKFIEIAEEKIPYLGPNNFGLQSINEGILTVVWIDNDLKGISKAEGEDVFSLCFEVIAPAGATTEIDFSPKPTPFEAVNLAEQVMGINTKKGKLTVVD
ncbi:MAG: cohesin domain-containing protein [Bacteroidota bacterium]